MTLFSLKIEHYSNGDKERNYSVDVHYQQHFSF